MILGMLPEIQNQFARILERIDMKFICLRFFCILCVWWEEAINHHNTRAQRDSAKYTCRANHYDWMIPHPMWMVSAQNRLLSQDKVQKLLRIPLLHIPVENREEEEDNETLSTCESTTADDEDKSEIEEEVIQKEHFSQDWDIMDGEEMEVIEQSTTKQHCLEDGGVGCYANAHAKLQGTESKVQ